MQRELLQARLRKLDPALAGLGQDEDEEDESEVLADLPSIGKGKQRGSYNDLSHYSPMSGSDFFETALSVNVANATFRIYYTPPRPKPEEQPTLLVCHHGAGYSGLSFALLAKEVKQKSNGTLGVLAFDCRGHGSTKSDTPNTTPPDLSLDILSADLVAVLKSLFPDKEQAPAFLLVGHSMGGAVVTDACNRIQDEVSNVAGLAVLDIVEGTAIEALGIMNTIIQARPAEFGTIETAIAWHIDSRTLRNPDSARVSVPPLFHKEETEGNPVYRWRTDLAATSPYWEGWFTGLSKKFLTAKSAKLLVLADADRLDTEMLVGQMQGKYQTSVLADVGHCLHEDGPDQLCDVLVDFEHRNGSIVDILKKVKKVGQA